MIGTDGFGFERACRLTNTVHSEVLPSLSLPSLPVFFGAPDPEIRLSEDPFGSVAVRSIERTEVLACSGKIAELLGNCDVSYLNLRNTGSAALDSYGVPSILTNEVLRYNPEAFGCPGPGFIRDQCSSKPIFEQKPFQQNLPAFVHGGSSSDNLVDRNMLNETELAYVHAFYLTDIITARCCEMLEDFCGRAEIPADDRMGEEGESLPHADVKMLVDELLSIRAKRSLHLVPVDTLVRLLNVLDHQIQCGQGLSITENEKSITYQADSDDLSSVTSALEATHAALIVMTHQDMPKQIYKEEIIERILDFSRHQIMECMAACDPSYRALQKPIDNGFMDGDEDEEVPEEPGSVGRNRRNIKGVRMKRSTGNKISEAVYKILKKLYIILDFLKDLLSIERLPDSCILQLVKTSFSTFLVDNIQLLQLKAISLICGVFISYVQHRSFLMDETLQLLWKLPYSKRAFRAYHLPDEEQKQIQMITELKVIMENLVMDLLTTLNLPEYPASATILENAGLKSKDTSARCMAIDILGTIAARLKRDAVACNREKFWILQELISEDSNISGVPDDGCSICHVERSTRFYLCLWFKHDSNSQERITYYFARLKSRAILRDYGTTLMSRDLARKISIVLGQKLSFSRGFDKILSLLLVSNIVEADPEVLCEKNVQCAVEGRFCDSAISVREAALELVGKHIASHPDVGLKYFQKVSERIKDTGISVRKRAIRIIRDMCISNANFSEITIAFIEIISRVNDEESSVQDLVCKTFYEFWFEEPSGTYTRFVDSDSPVPIEVARKTEQIVDVLRKMLNHHLLVTVIKRNLTLDFLPQSSKATGINAVLLASVRRRYNAGTVHSDIAQSHTVGSKDVDTRTVATLLESIIFVIDAVLPLLRKPPKSVVEELELDLKQMIVRHSFLSVVHACIKCLCSLCKVAGKGAGMVEYLIQVFFKQLDGVKVDNKQQLVGRSLFCLGLLIRYGYSLTNSSNDKHMNVSKSLSLLKKYFEVQDFSIRVRSLQALGFVLIAKPECMLEHDIGNIIGNALSTDSDSRLKSQALQNLLEYLLDAENQMEVEVANNAGGRNSGDGGSKVPIAAGAERCVDADTEVRQSALKIVEIVLRQGLVHPITCVPYLIALEADPLEVNTKLAHHLLMALNEKEQNVSNEVTASLDQDESCTISKAILQQFQIDCHAAMALQLLLKLKRHLKIVYSLNDERCQSYYPTEALRPGETLSRQNIPFNLGDVSINLPTSYSEMVEKYQDFKAALKDDTEDYATYTATLKRKRPTPRSSRSGKSARRMGNDGDDDDEVVGDDDWTGGPRRLSFVPGGGQRGNFNTRSNRQRL
ncbi:hypothetical protein QJS10_CPB15g01459 [Acorus calamus]|uniref:Sister chromatid cohesion protein n=1 Tax=Acorus calamus TaxID=4465 RepID=A0AAV9D927_ACOCL|nr:hypothetical protein QJS10_CPB15g01459 [Acorus calamus]